MNIVLLRLSGDPDVAAEQLRARFPDAAIHHFSRDEFEKRTTLKRLSLLRRLKPEVFAVGTERLVWQRGQDALLLLGALAGARRSIIFDSHGGWREEWRIRILVHAPP